MSHISVFLFGRFELHTDHSIAMIDGHRLQELLAYLLLNMSHPQPRELVADTILHEACPEQSRRAMRQALWKLQKHLEPMHLLDVDPTFIGIRPASHLELDVTAFESAYEATRGQRGADLDATKAERLMAADARYRGDLLEGWYADWCLLERERLAVMHVAILNKLTAWCAWNDRYEDGVQFGHRALRHDPAHERTHRHLMRLHALAGDRCLALRQYRLCVQALREQLDVAPEARTDTLYQQIAAGSFAPSWSDSRRAEILHRQEQVRDLNDTLLSLSVRLREIEERLSLNGR